MKARKPWAAACGVVLAVSACDGGGAFAASAELVNQCDVPVVVSIGNNFAESLELPRPAQVTEVAPGATFILNNAVLKPVPDTVYVYVAIATDAEFSGPTAVRLTTLPLRKGERSTDVYTFVLSGDMCP